MKNKYLFLALLCIAGTLLCRQVSNAQMTAQQAIPLMIRGINIGNSLDAVPDETSWGNPLIQQSYFVAYKNAGFNCVRVPVTWDAHVGTASPYTIDPAWLSRVKQVVDWGLSQGLFIIINAHHEAWLKNNPSAANIARFQSIWSQIANTFKNESDHLFFEILNEPNPMSMANVNSINSSILSIIRQTNPTRIVIYSGNNYSNTPELEGAAIPNTNDRYLMGYYHSYDPWNFAGLAQGTWGSSGDINAMKAKYDDIKNWSNAHNIPVIIDECGAVVACDYNSRIAYFTNMVQQSISHSIPFCAWDDNGSFQIYQRSSNTWSAIKDILINTSPIQPPPAYVAITSTIQAESYAQMLGIQTETTSDAGGGLDVGYIDANDWMTYNVSVPTAGSYTIRYRVASLSGGGVLQLEQAGGGTVYGTLNVPATGGWQTWTTLTQTVNLPAGNQQLAIKANAGGFNINWWGQATTGPTSWSLTIQAESYAQMFGIQTETTSDAGGGLDVGYIDASDWMLYNNVNIPASGTYTIEYRVASQSGGGSLQFERGGGTPVYGTLNVPSTGGWQTWITIKHTVNLTAGSQSFGIKALAGGWNINWFTITQGVKSTGSEGNDLNSKITIFPSPAREKITLSGLIEGINQVEIYDMNGKLWISKKINNVYSTEIDISGLTRGLYILNVITPGNSFKSLKFVKE